MADNTKHTLYGLHAIEAVVDNPRHTIQVLYINHDRQDKRLHALLTKVQAKNIPLVPLNSQAMKQQFPNIKHQGVVAIMDKVLEYNETDLTQLLTTSEKKLFILILDGITDPHNLGACLRTADAVGVDVVITPKDNSAQVNATVSKVACGAAEAIPVIRVANLARTLDTLKAAGVWLYGAAGEAPDSLYEMNLKETSVAILMGAEGKGLRRLTKDYCDGLFSIPMYGNVSSLNVSVATGICLYEVIRQRLSHNNH